MGGRPAIAIASVAGDMHAYLVAETITSKWSLRCHVIETNRLSSQSTLTWAHHGSRSPTARLTDALGNELAVEDLSVVWWRRFSRVQDGGTHDKSQKCCELINNDCWDSLRGTFLSTFGGIYVSDPDATWKASNKLLQLETARKSGLRIPPTLISNDPIKVRQFCDEAPAGVVAKSVLGTSAALLPTVGVNQQTLNDEAISRSPLIYQHLVRGNEHLRINCFGEQVIAVRIVTDKLDWRPNLMNTMNVVELKQEALAAVKNMLVELRLRMGIVDLKVSAEDGLLYFFEVNPQGQFLFLEPLAKYPLLSKFSQFLVDLAQSST